MGRLQQSLEQTTPKTHHSVETCPGSPGSLGDRTHESIRTMGLDVIMKAQDKLQRRRATV